MGRHGKILEELDRKIDLVDGRVDALDKSIDLGLQDIRFRQTVVGVLMVTVPSIVGAVLWYLAHLR